MSARLLEFDPTPAGLVTHPLRAYKSIWAKVRRTLLKEYGAVCQVCGHVAEARRHIHCHEVYAFPDNTVVKLGQVMLLCWRCHDAIHFDRTQRRSGEEYIREIASHYRAVNGGLSEKAFERDLDTMFRRTNALRKSYGGPAATPPLDYGPYQSLVTDYLARKSVRKRGHDDDGDEFEMVPDHEFPEDTAMWRECFD